MTSSVLKNMSLVAVLILVLFVSKVLAGNSLADYTKCQTSCNSVWDKCVRDAGGVPGVDTKKDTASPAIKTCNDQQSQCMEQCYKSGMGEKDEM